VGRKLYVGNLPFTVTDQELGDIFAQVGTVASARVITDRMTGRSKGFGFVEMNTDEEATNAINQFNGAELQGRPLTVNEAKPMEPRTGGFGGGGGDRPRGDRGGFGGGRGGPRGGDRGGRRF
jgi:RNA recognition motif-containing protein